MTTEIDIPTKTIEILVNHVMNNISIEELGKFPFYTKVDKDLLIQAFSNIIRIECVTTAYIYAHNEPISLHVDRYKKDSLYNLCVPLITNDTDQSFLVFDQIFDKSGAVWEYDKSVREQHRPLTEKDKESSNEDNDHNETLVYVGVRPCDTDNIVGLTEHSLPEKLNDFLPHPPEFYHGLTGISWKWRPGKALAFKSSQIHGTGKQKDFKIGCVLLLNSEDFLKIQ
jgi:hypothetical protein